MFGEMVREYRRALALTQEELAARTGMSVRGIRKIETGQVDAPRPSTLRLLADAFDLSGEERRRFCRLAHHLEGADSVGPTAGAGEPGNDP